MPNKRYEIRLAIAKSAETVQLSVSTNFEKLEKKRKSSARNLETTCMSG